MRIENHGLFKIVSRIDGFDGSSSCDGIMFESVPFLTPWGNETRRVEENLLAQGSTSGEMNVVSYDLFVAIGENAGSPMTRGMRPFGYGGNLANQNDSRHAASIQCMPLLG